MRAGLEGLDEGPAEIGIDQVGHHQHRCGREAHRRRPRPEAERGGLGGLEGDLRVSVRQARDDPPGPVDDQHVGNLALPAQGAEIGVRQGDHHPRRRRVQMRRQGRQPHGQKHHGLCADGLETVRRTCDVVRPDGLLLRRDAVCQDQDQRLSQLGFQGEQASVRVRPDDHQGAVAGSQQGGWGHGGSPDGRSGGGARVRQNPSRGVNHAEIPTPQPFATARDRPP